MRFLRGILCLTFALSAWATEHPISVSDVALMLRSGYSSDSILREVMTHRITGTLDATARKSLMEFGASAALIEALESGAFQASAPEAERAQQLQTKRAMEAEEARKAEAAFQAQQAQMRANTAKPQQPAGTPILDFLRDKLVQCHDGIVSTARPQALEKKSIVALYFSAHWCPPCRKFTPQLVDYYNRVSPRHPEFELIFVSADRSRFGWETYIHDTNMPWLAIDYDRLADMAGVQKLGGDSIPSLVVFDAGGRILASSNVDGKYVGPENTLAALDKILASAGSQPLAQVR